MSVADLLAQSRAAHGRYRQAAGHIDRTGGVILQPDDHAARLHIVDALHARQQAEAADPTHTDPAWSADAALNKGIPSAEMLTFFHRFFTA